MVEKITACGNVPRMTIMRAAVALCLCFCGWSAAQTSGPPQPPDRPALPPPGEKKDPRENGPPFGKSGFGRDYRGGGMFGWGSFPGGMSGELFEKLPEAERQRVRDALAKAWQSPRMEQARENLSKAHAEFREAMRASLDEADPGVSPIIEKVKPPLPELPPASDPAFPRVALERFRAEVILRTRPERREELKKDLDRLMSLPPVKRAISELEQAPPEKRMEALHRLSAVWRETAYPRKPDKPERPGEGGPGGPRPQ